MILTRRHRFQVAALAGLAAALSWMVAPASSSGSSSRAPMSSVIVQGPQSAQHFVKSVGGRITHDLPMIGGFSARVPANDLPLLSQLPGVVGVMPDLPTHVQSTPGTYNNLPSVYKKTTHGDALANSGGNGQGVTVALIDTGVTSLPDIAGAIRSVYDPATLGMKPCVNFTTEATCDDTFGHGTFMAGIIAGNGASSNGKYVGMAPAAKIISLKISGATGASDVSTIIAALQWVVANQSTYNIRALNLSLGTDSTQSYTIDPLDYAVEKAWQAGVVVNVAASNQGPAAGTISKPADDPFVITVGAIDDKGTNGVNDDVVPNFTGRGPTAADGLIKPDVVAPGGHIVSLAAPGATLTTQIPSTMAAPYRRGSGTSMSTAVVTGLVAQMLSLNPTLTPDRVKYELMSTTRTTYNNPATTVGAGLVDGSAALFAGPGVANSGVAPSMGTGSLADSRGTVGVVLDDTNQTVLDASSGDLTAALTDLETSGGNWFGGNWFGGNWFGGNWFGGNWFGGNWFGGNWFGGNWFGGNWFGGNWFGGNWFGVDSSSEDYGGNWFGGAWYGSYDQ